MTKDENNKVNETASETTESSTETMPLATDDSAGKAKNAKAEKPDKSKSKKTPAAAKSDSNKKKKSLSKWFKDSKAEFKKVVWPSRKTVVNNTIIVVVCLIITGLFIWGVDTLFGFTSDFLVNLGK